MEQSLAGYGPWGHKESDMTQHTCTHTQDTMLAMNSALCHLTSNGFTFHKKKKKKTTGMASHLVLSPRLHTTERQENISLFRVKTC